MVEIKWSLYLLTDARNFTKEVRTIKPFLRQFLCPLMNRHINILCQSIQTCNCGVCLVQSFMILNPRMLVVLWNLATSSIYSKQSEREREREKLEISIFNFVGILFLFQKCSKIGFELCLKCCH